MTFTTDPTTTIGVIRLALGDDNDAAPEDLRLEDEAYAALILLETGTSSPTGAAVYSAIVACGSALRAKFLRKAEGSPGPDRVQPTSRAQELANLITHYRTKAKSGAAPIAGGMSVAENVALASDADRVGSFARMGMMDNC